jgi:hypothetical protein
MDKVRVNYDRAGNTLSVENNWCQVSFFTGGRET